jgi:hypothetical protein
VLSLPQPEVTKFTGDLANYRTFISTSDSRVAIRSSSNADKLYYLDQHLVGEPKDLIGGCFHLDSDTGYSEARKLLDKEYGDLYKISMMYLSKITEWPVIKADDNVGLKKLSLFLVNCYHAMKCMSYLNVLIHPPNMLNIVQKLPFYLQNKWREHASRMRRTSQTIMQFQDLMEFTASASDTANDPVYGRTAMTPRNPTRPFTDSSRPDLRSKGKQKSASFATNVFPEPEKRDVPICPLCRQQHDLDSCKQFTSKTMDHPCNSAANQFSCYFTVPNDAFQVQATCLLIGPDLLIGDSSHMPVFYCLTGKLRRLIRPM